MKNALIIHGKPSKQTYFDPTAPTASNQNWLPWLQKQLQLAGIAAQTPEMINAWQPDYAIWSQTIENFAVTPETILIGHSMGGGFLVQWLSEHKEVRAGNVFLVAPSVGDRFTPEHPMEAELLGGMGDFDVDPDLLSRVRSLTILNSDDDRERVQATVKYLREELPEAGYREFHERGHFTGVTEFPELLEEILRKQ
jgi:predicted alpha/beta hydrolase family esterase